MSSSSGSGRPAADRWQQAQPQRTGQAQQPGGQHTGGQLVAADAAAAAFFSLPWNQQGPVAEQTQGGPKQKYKHSWASRWDLEESEERHAKLNETALKAYSILDEKVRDLDEKVRGLECLVKTADLAERMGQHDVIVKRLSLLNDRLCAIAEKVEVLTKAVAELQVPRVADGRSPRDVIQPWR